MIWGAVLGFFIFSGLGTIRDTWHHRGAGYVTYEQPERTEKVSESQYKRHQYVMGGLLLALGFFLWIVVARSARDKKEKTEEECEPDDAANGSQPIRSETNSTSSVAGSRR